MLKRFTPIVVVCALACSGTQTNNDVAKTDEQATAKPAAPTVNADIFKPALADLATQERDAQQEAIVDWVVICTMKIAYRPTMPSRVIAVIS